MSIFFVVIPLDVFWTGTGVDARCDERVARLTDSSLARAQPNSETVIKDETAADKVDGSSGNGAKKEASKEDGIVTQTTEEPNQSNGNGITFWELLRAGGVIGYIIILLSFVAVAIVIEFLITIRRDRLIPADLADNTLQHLSQGELGVAMKLCQEKPSLLANVLYAGMKEFEFGWDAVERGAEETMEKEASKLYRKIEYLNVIGNIVPMLGLLGTVVGMIIAFKHLAESGGSAKPNDLAEGIYLALVTTVQGLIVALPALGIHSILAGRIASLVTETTEIAEQVLNPIKRSFLKKKQNNT
jgi:biopolymer transport protein ExbB